MARLYKYLIPNLKKSVLNIMTGHGHSIEDTGINEKFRSTAAQVTTIIKN